MKTKVNTNALKSMINQVMPAVGTSDIETNIHVESYGRRLVISACGADDMAIEVNTQDAEIETPGSVLINARKLKAIVEAGNPESDTILASPATADKVEVSVGQANYRFGAAKLDDWPNYEPDTSEAVQYEMLAADLKTALNCTMFATGSEKAIPALRGVHFDIGNGVMKVTASDGSRIAKKIVAIDDETDEIESFTVGKPTLKSLTTLFLSKVKDDDKIVLTLVPGRKLIVSNNNVRLVGSLIASGYPETDGLIIKNENHVLTIDPLFFMFALRGCSALNEASNTLAPVTLTLREGAAMHLSRNAGDDGTYEEDLDCDYKGDNLKITVDADYMLDAVKALGVDTLKFYFGGAEKPIVGQADGDDSCWQVIAPIRQRS